MCLAWSKRGPCSHYWQVVILMVRWWCMSLRHYHPRSKSILRVFKTSGRFFLVLSFQSGGSVRSPRKGIWSRWKCGQVTSNKNRGLDIENLLQNSCELVKWYMICRMKNSCLREMTKSQCSHCNFGEFRLQEMCWHSSPFIRGDCGIKIKEAGLQHQGIWTCRWTIIFSSKQGHKSKLLLFLDFWFMKIEPWSHYSNFQQGPEDIIALIRRLVLFILIFVFVSCVS